MLKIIDCFIFYNELDLLNYRLNILDNLVDYFVIVEATHTFTGKEKQLYFNENKHLFEKFNKKIIHIIVDDLPYIYPNINFENNEQWRNEFFQRNAMSRGLKYINNLHDSDVIIVSDLDEIPDPYVLDKIKKGDIVIDIYSLEMDMYYYNLITKHKNKWLLCKILNYKKYKELNMKFDDIRNMPCCRILNSGWHLSYFGDKYFIKNKINHFSHQEYNNDNYTDLSIIEERINNSTDLYGRTEIDIEKIQIKDNQYLPTDYDKYLKNYYQHQL